MSLLFIPPVVRATDSNGTIIPGAKWYFYETGTLNLTPVYTDASLSTPHTNPVIADASGLFPPIYLDPAVTYRATQKTAGDVEIEDVDPVNTADLRLDLAKTTGATLVGTTGGGTVQGAIDARPTAAVLANTGGAALIGEEGGATVQAVIAELGTKDEGVLPSGGYTPFFLDKSASGNPVGNSDWRSVVFAATLTGGYGSTQVSTENVQLNINHTSGTVTYAYGLQGYIALGVPSTLTTTGSVTTMRGAEFHVSHTGTGNVTSAYCFNAFADLDVGSGSIDKFVGYRIDDFTAGSGSRLTTSAMGFFVANTTACSCPTVAAYGSEMTSGSGRFNLYFNGSANSVMAGGLRIGDLNSPTEKLEVAGNALVTGNLNVTSVYKVGGTQVLGARQTGCPGNATDLATALTLVNFLRTALIAHGIVS